MEWSRTEQQQQQQRQRRRRAFTPRLTTLSRFVPRRKGKETVRIPHPLRWSDTPWTGSQQAPLRLRLLNKPSGGTRTDPSTHRSTDAHRGGQGGRLNTDCPTKGACSPRRAPRPPLRTYLATSRSFARSHRAQKRKNTEYTHTCIQTHIRRTHSYLFPPSARRRELVDVARHLLLEHGALVFSPLRLELAVELG